MNIQKPAQWIFVLLICLFIQDKKGSAQEENLEVFHQWVKWNHPGSMLIHDLTAQANELYEKRDREIGKLRTKADWLGRQAEVKDRLRKLVGPFPDKTPLNPITTGIVQRDGFRVEKIIYESMPDFYVTGCLFLPDNIEGKAPAVLNLIGHNQEAFRAELYQQVIINLVRKGMIVLAIDPLGQGEQVQYYDPEIDFSSIGYTVIEHCYFGNQCFLAGVSPCRYFIWDGIRGIDYLLTRDDVDPERIGVTGFSGGGTIASYVAAFDERVKVSVPCSWSTASRRQLETKGVQDAETVFIRGLEEGITFEDLIEVRAPKPALLTFVSRDQYLSIQGARESFREAKKAYDMLGYSENLEMAEDDFEHWMTPKIRSKIYAFFLKHFNLPGKPDEEPVDLLSRSELTVTATGQISTSLGGDRVFDVNRRETEELVRSLEGSREDISGHLDAVSAIAKEISGFEAPGDTGYECFLNGRYRREGYSLSKIAIKGGGNYLIPMLLFVPEDITGKCPAVIYLHPDGKAVEATPGGEIEKLVRQGYIVAAVDVLGMGESRNTATRSLGPGYTALLIGRSVVGIQAGDVARVAGFLSAREDVDHQKIGAMARGEACLPLIHAAAFDTTIHHVTLIGSPISYRSIAMNRFYRIGLTDNEGGGTGHPYEVDFSWGVAGVLRGYDLPDLIACLAPRKVILANLLDPMGQPAPAELVESETAFPRRVYTFKKAARNLRIVPVVDGMAPLLDWGFR